VAANAAAVDVTGLSAAVKIDHSEATNDTLAVEAREGDDTIAAGLNLAALIKLTVDGGAGQDTIAGGDGADMLIGGTENDSIDGNRGNDVGLLGDGDDTFTWDPGDGSDTVEGQAGSDTMRFNGAGANEVFDLSANGPRLRFTRDVANIVMDVDGTELIDTQALGGTDTATVHDLSGTAVTRATFDLEAAIGGAAGDGQPDTVVVEGTGGADTIDVVADAGAVNVLGLAAVISLEHAEPANDILRVNSLAGNDDVEVAAGVPALVQAQVDLGADG
jgi:Ca2+-binding RTX toxin-like protein